MRWGGVAYLESIKTTYDDNGDPVFTPVDTMVFCNERTVGLNNWAAARSAGLKDDAEIEIRTQDYSGQQRVTYGIDRMTGEPVKYDVERVSVRGEFTYLTLARRLKDGH